MSGEEKQPSESWPPKLAKALVEHALKTIIAVPVVGFMTLVIITLGGYYDLIPCGLRQWIWGVHC